MLIAGVLILPNIAGALLPDSWDTVLQYLPTQAAALHRGRVEQRGHARVHRRGDRAGSISLRGQQRISDTLCLVVADCK
jgi:hypothetical protein